MFLLTEDAELRCKHLTGRVKITTSQDWVTAMGKRLLVEPDVEGRPIGGCSNAGPTIKPCLCTLKVMRGYSDLLRIDGHRVCLDAIRGLTDGTPPGLVEYEVDDPGQPWVTEGGAP
jgi:hypothetical protein